MSKISKFIICSFLCLIIASPAAAFSNMAKTPAASDTPEVAGTVVETMNAGGYTYVRLENNGMEAWAAVPKTQVKVGEKVELAKGAVMTNFESKSLGRTFPAILFSGGIIRR